MHHEPYTYKIIPETYLVQIKKFGPANIGLVHHCAPHLVSNRITKYGGLDCVMVMDGDWLNVRNYLPLVVTLENRIMLGKFFPHYLRRGDAFKLIPPVVSTEI